VTDQPSILDLLDLEYVEQHRLPHSLHGYFLRR